MNIPWDDEVTASIDGASGREVLAQAKLRDVIPLLASQTPAQCARILLAFADRSSPPFRYDGKQIAELAQALRRQRWADNAAGE